MFKLVERLRALSLRLATSFSDSAARAAWLLALIALVALVAVFNSSKLLALAWLAAKIIAAALLAVALFRTWVRHDADSLEGIERSMAETGRVTLMAAAIIAAAFTP